MRTPKLQTLGAAVLAVVTAAGCLAPKDGASSSIGFGDGVQPAAAPGQYTVLGWSELDASNALSEALGKAQHYASKKGYRARPLRVEAGEGRDPLGRAVVTARLVFALEVDPNQAAAVSASSARNDGELPTALDQRLQRMVEDGLITLEAYERLIAQQRARALADE